MKLAIVPAQVTTVEDKVAGNLSLTQLVLLAAPVFVSGVLYGILPTPFEPEVYKIILIVLVVLGFAVMALRIRGMLVFEWIRVLVHYNRRPRYYVLNKNDAYLRHLPKHVAEEVPMPVDTKQGQAKQSPPSFTAFERARFEQLVSSSSTKVAFKRTNKKGNLHVTLKEI